MFSEKALLTILLVVVSVPLSSAQGTFSNTGNMNTARYRHTAVVLPSGQVLVAGGVDASANALSSAELYNPATGTWTVTGSMADTRQAHTATLLPNGEVLVAGGFVFNSCSATAELFNPSTGLWTSTGSMTQGRCGHTATLLSNGQVLVAGGYVLGSDFNPSLASAELYNPSTGSWQATGSLNVARSGAAAVLLANGQVLVGINVAADGAQTLLASTELYNPSKGQWAVAQSLNLVSPTATLTLLGNGDVLEVGGPGEFADPSVLTWTNTGSYPRVAGVYSGHAETLLRTGKVLVTGTRCNYSGCSAIATESCFLYNVSTNSWSIAGSMHHSRVFHTATLLPNGQVLVAGGQFGLNPGTNVLASAELYTP